MAEIASSQYINLFSDSLLDQPGNKNWKTG